MKITVTKEHIEQGCPANYRYCPVALAVKGQCRTEQVQVFNWSIRIKSEVFAMPPKAKRFIKRFDSDSPVRPFSFELVKA